MKKYEYECVVVYSSDIDESSVAAQNAKLTSIVEAHGGTVTHTDVWGRRKLAYKIQKREYGFYVMYLFTGDSSLVADLERQLRINELVMRYLTVCKDKFAPDMKHSNARDTGELPFASDDGIGGDDGADLSA